MQDLTDETLNVTLEELEADPHPIYKEMWRREQPIAYVPDVGMALVTSWELCDEAVHRDEDFGPTHEIFSNVYGNPNILSLSGQSHDDMREIINPPLRPRAVRGQEDTLRAEVVRRVEAMKSQGRAEASKEILEPISQRAVGNVIGLKTVDDVTISKWFSAYGAYLVDVGRNPSIADSANEAKLEVREFVERRIGEMSGNHDGSALGHMLFDGMPASEHRDVDEVIGSLGVMIVGGIQEPAHAAASALLGILSHPDAHNAMVSDPNGVAASAFEEGLRWIAPFGIGHRRVRHDTELGGVFFPQGTEVAIARDSANRDPKRYENPDHFDLKRPQQAHMAFGSTGPHFCMGHFVARSLGKIILEEMFSRLPGLRLDPGQPTVVHGWNVRGPKELSLVWDEK